MNKYDLTKEVIGTIIGFEQSEASPTGYIIKFLARGEERAFPAAKSVYDIQFSDKFFPYPCLGEIIFLALRNPDDIVTELIIANHPEQEGNPFATGFVLGTYRMFQIKITAETPRIGDILRVEQNSIHFYNYDKMFADGLICHSVNAGKFPKPADGISFPLASDTDVYTWDWTAADRPFSKCSREEAKARGYVTRATVGSIKDIGKNCYWIGFYSTRGNEDQCDLIKCFLNEAPGWE